MKAEGPDFSNPGSLDLTSLNNYNRCLRKWKAHWWGSRTSNPVCCLRGRQVGSIPMHFRQLLTWKKIKAKGVVKLGGIWEGMGFEKLNLKKELKLLRNDL